MKIDVFNHVLPRRFFEEMIRVAPGHKDMGKRVRNIPALVDMDVRFKMMDRFGAYCQIISLASPPLEAFAGPETTPLLARIANDGMAELVDRHPDRFPGFAASLPMNSPERALAELHRAVGVLGARGVQIFSNAAGRPLDAPELAPLFDAMAAYDLPILLHPARGANRPDYLGEEKSKYEIWVGVGLALRDERRDGAAGFCRTFRQASESQDPHPSHGRNDSVLRGAGRPRLGPVG